MDDIKTPRKKKTTKLNSTGGLPAKEVAVIPAEPTKQFVINDNTQSSSNDDIKLNELDIDPKEEEMPKNNSYNLSIGSKHRSKKKLIIIICIILALILSAVAIYWFFIKKDTKKVVSAPAQTKKQEAPKKPISPLTGIEVASADLANRPVTGVMIENSPDARPQSGLIDAGIVYEAIAEGGITRFLAIYQESQPQYIGPIRSVRPYYLDFLLPFNGGLAHVGGSPDALADIKTFGVHDLDQFFNGDFFQRITQRFAPHNVYTSFAKLDELNKAKNFIYNKFSPFERKKDVAQTPTASVIDLAISGPQYSPRFEYDPATNSYKRFQDGQPHIDEKTKTQISPKTVVVLVMDQTTMADGFHTAYKDTGSGKMYVFQDGIVSEGTWEKPDRKSQFVFKDNNGLPMKLNAGQTWISIVGSSSDINYKP